jgi:hypothetical protein
MRMRNANRSFQWAGSVFAGLLLTAGAAAAQLQTGNLYGKVIDEQGAPLAGVTVSLDTGAAPEVQTSNAWGEFRFLDLPPATMKLKVALEGYLPLEYDKVKISVGRNTTIEVTLASAAVIDIDITYVVGSPDLDPHQVARGATITHAELQGIPTSRDPWTLLSTVAGVQVDRVNVGGNESGQQSVYVGPGSFGGNSVWSVDGVVITDMAALGSSPSYYDFDAFQEMQVTTGGTDSTIATGGVAINLVTKRGTNELSGSARYLDTPGSTEAGSSFDNRQLPPGQSSPRTSNAISVVRDFGAEAGGPIWKDHLWFWGSYGNQEVQTVAFGGTKNAAKLPTLSAKANAQLSNNNSLTLFALDNAKTVKGRDAGPQRTQPTTWDQGHEGSRPSVAKVEDTHIASANLFVTGLFSAVNGGFHLIPEGGVGPVTYEDAGRVFHNSFLAIVSPRPQQQGKVDSSVFFELLGNLSNELKYGAGYRRVETDSLSTFGPGIILDHALVGLPAGDNVFAAARAANAKIRTAYTSGYVQDTLAVGNLTANAGVRYDLQQGHNNPTTLPASADAPGLLPAYSYPGSASGFSWSSFTPRLGATYALGKDRNTLLRASYSRFADQLGAGFAGVLNPTAVETYYYFLTPQTGPGLPTMLAPAGPPGTNYSGRVNPSTGLPLAVNAVNPHFSAPLTDEVLASLEHAFLPDLVAGLNLTYRHLSNQVPADNGAGALGIPLVFDSPNPFDPATLGSVGRPATPNDFMPIQTQVTLPNGQMTTVTSYVLKPNVSTRGGSYLTNGGTPSDYKGASLSLTKRLSSRWMMRGSFTYNDWKFGNPGSLPDPTDFAPGGNRAGDAVLVASAGSGPKQYVFINSKYSYNLNGMYEVAPQQPWGFNVAGNFTGHQGYALPYFVAIPYGGSNYPGSGTLSANVLAGRPDAQRLPGLNVLDARIEKDFTFQELGLTLGVDAFNLFNASTITQRVSNLGQPNTNFVNEVLAPRVYRFGARLNFR